MDREQIMVKLIVANSRFIFLFTSEGVAQAGRGCAAPAKTSWEAAQPRPACATLTTIFIVSHAPQGEMSNSSEYTGQDAILSHALSPSQFPSVAITPRFCKSITRRNGAGGCPCGDSPTPP